VSHSCDAHSLSADAIDVLLYCGECVAHLEVLCCLYIATVVA
jgi:hypothetical protein